MWNGPVLYTRGAQGPGVHTAVVAGVGPGLGASLARRFAEEGCRVGLLARSEPFLAKFACRGMAESLARELGPEGIHVAHVVIDGQILTPEVEAADPDRPAEEYLDPDAIADTYWHLVEQDRSSWSLEVDVRPHVEDF